MARLLCRNSADRNRNQPGGFCGASSIARSACLNQGFISILVIVLVLLWRPVLIRDMEFTQYTKDTRRISSFVLSVCRSNCSVTPKVSFWSHALPKHSSMRRSWEV